MKVAISAIRTRNIKLNRYELIQGLQTKGHNIYYIGQNSNNTIHPDYKKYNVQYLSIPIERDNTNPFIEIKTLIKAKKVLKKNQIEAIIVYGIRTFPTMVIAAKLAGVKNIICIVNGTGRLLRLKGFKGTVIKSISYPMLWLSLVISNKVFFQNPDDLKMIKNKRLLLKRNHEIINGSGVNLETFKPEELEQEPVFLMIARLTGDKGVNEYIQAAKKVKKMYPNSTFNLIGALDKTDSSLDFKEFNQAIREKSIIWKDTVEDVRPYISQSRIFVLPSYFEGTPRVTLEAMAMGRPIITTDTSGCRETVIEGVNGFKVPVKNVEKLTSKMKWMINNPLETADMGKESRRLAETNFDVYDINKKIINSINS